MESMVDRMPRIVPKVAKMATAGSTEGPDGAVDEFIGLMPPTMFSARSKIDSLKTDILSDAQRSLPKIGNRRRQVTRAK